MRSESAAAPLILVTDDTDSNRYVISRVLERAAFQVIEASDAAECLEKARQSPQLIILDVGLPDMNGYEVIRKLKANPATGRIPILLMSASFVGGKAGPVQNEKNPEIVAEGYLVQPVEPLVLVATVRSILRVRETEREMERLVADLKEAVQTRDEFLSIASHELRTPITSMKLQAQMRRREVKKHGNAKFSAERLEDMFTRDERLIGNLSRLVDDMLDISRISAGKLHLNPEIFDLSELVQEVATRLQPQAALAGSNIAVERNGPTQGNWDRFRLEQVLINLLTNAFRYGRGSSIKVRVSGRDGRAIVEVEDHGIGISEADQSRIFQRFERAVDHSTSSGLGLGLFIARSIVEAHHGEIHVTSTLGSGSIFSVELPLLEGTKMRTVTSQG